MKNYLGRNLFQKLCIGVTFATLSFNAIAQESGEEVAGNAAAFVLENVVVTATKREQLQQEVPIAMSVLSTEEIDRKGLNTLQDLQYEIPNLTMSVVTPFASWVNVRGIPSNPNGVFNSGSSPGLGIYVDGVVYARQTGFNVELANMERVEVLRGPQGTLFGQNTNLGVISYTTRKPGNEFEGKLKAAYGSFDNLNLSGYVSAPVVKDKFAIGISGFLVNGNGSDRSGYDGDPAYHEDRVGGRIQLRWTPSDALSIDINGDILKDRGSGIRRSDITSLTPGGMMATSLALSALNPAVETMTLDQIVVPGKRTVSTRSDENKSRRDNYGIDGTIAYEFGNGMSVKSITAYKDYDSALIYDLGGTALRMFPNIQAEDNSQFTQEFQLLSPADASINYVVGMFYLDNKSINHQSIAMGEHFWYARPPGRRTDVDAEVRTKSLAWFAHVSADISESTNIFAGLRYSDVKKDITLEQYDDVFIFGYPTIPLTMQEKNDDFLSWTAGIGHHVETDSIDLNFFAKVSTGYKEGGFTVRTLTLAEIGDPLDPDLDFDKEKVVSYELGVKGTLFNDRLSIALTGFVLDYEDIQTTVFDDNDAGHVTNGPKAKSKGFEFDVTWIVNDNIRFKGAVGLSDAKYGEFDSCSLTVDCTGNRVAGSSKWTANIGIDYNYPIGGSWALDGGIDLTYRSGRFGSAQNDNATTPSHTTLNAQIGVRSDEHGFQFLVVGKNLTNADNIQAVSTSGIFGYASQRYSPKRSFMFQAVKDF